MMQRKTYLFARLLLALGALLPACGNGNQGSGAYLISWQFKYGNYLNSSTPLQDRTCANENPNWPSSAIDKVEVTIVDPDDYAAPYNESYSCTEGFAPKEIPLYGFSQKHWQVSLTAKRADGLALYSYDKTLIDFSKPLSEPLALHAVTGNLSFSLAFGTSSQLDCPSGVDKIELALYRQNSDDTYPGAATYFKSYTCNEIAYGLIITDLPAASDKPPAVVNYRFKAKALGQDGGVLYCVTEDRPVKPGSDNLRSNLLLKAGDCP